MYYKNVDALGKLFTVDHRPPVTVDLSVIRERWRTRISCVGRAQLENNRNIRSDQIRFICDKGPLDTDTSRTQYITITIPST